jgi:phospholipase C
VASETFDHTSQLRLLECRFGVEVPNLTPWRRQAVGDMTSALNMASVPNPARPPVHETGPLLAAAAEAQCGTNVAAGFLNRGTPYPVPPNSMPVQEPGTRGAPSGVVGASR